MVGRSQTIAVSLISMGNEIICNLVNRRKESGSGVFLLFSLHEFIRDATLPSKRFATLKWLGQAYVLNTIQLCQWKSLLYRYIICNFSLKNMDVHMKILVTSRSPTSFSTCFSITWKPAVTFITGGKKEQK